jgi:hypothetical protein
MAVPTVVSKSYRGGIASTLPADGSVSCAVDDVFIVAVESDGAQAAPSLSGGSGFGSWTQIASTATGGVRLTTWWARTTGTSASVPGTTDSGDHQSMGWIQIRGCRTSGDPWVDTPVTSSNTPASTSVSITGLTTTVTDALVLGIVAADLPDSTAGNRFTSWANTSLASVTEQMDGSTNAGNGGAIAMVTGSKAAAGVVSATTATQTDSAVRSSVVIAFAPAPEIVQAVGFASGAHTAHPVRIDLSRTTGPVDSVNAATAIRADQTLVVPLGGAVTETDTAVPITEGAEPITQAIGYGVEATIALSARVDLAHAAAPASEADTAHAIRVDTTGSLGVPSETDTPTSVRADQSRDLASADEVDTATAVEVTLPGPQSIPVGPADETDTTPGVAVGGASNVRVWDGAQMALAVPRRWTGSEWQPVTIRSRTATGWVPSA